jgi:hypothetical protein
VFTGLTVYLVLTEDDPAIQLALLAILIAFLPTIVAVVAFVASRETVPDLLGRLTRIELLLERITEATERERPEPNGGPEG